MFAAKIARQRLKAEGLEACRKGFHRLGTSGPKCPDCGAVTGLMSRSERDARQENDMIVRYTTETEAI